MRIKLHHELKELLPHLAEMSGNATKLCLFLHLNDREMGIDDDLARGCGWSLSTLKRAVRELRASHIVEALKSDPAEICRVNSDPAPEVKSDLAKGHGVKTDPHSQVPRFKSDLQAVPAFDVAAPTNTPAPSKQLEGIPGGDSARVAAAIEKRYLAGELSDVARQALRYLRFDADPASLSRGFVSVLDWLGKRQHLPLPGILATMILDRCLFQQRKKKAEGKDFRLYAWPAGFQKWRDSLRRAEREQGRQERVRAVA